MIKKQNKEWFSYLSKALKQLTQGRSLHFKDIKPSILPEKSGVYLISVNKNNNEEPYYIGRTKNIKQRLYYNHLMGRTTNAHLKRYLVSQKECKNPEEAKQFIRKYCSVRWFSEIDHRKRGAVEGYVTGIIFPKYGIYEEH